MLPIMGTSMLEAVLSQLASHGVDEAVLSLGYLPDKFIEAYPDGTCAGVRLRYAVEPEPLDTAGAIRFAAQELEGLDTFIVVNGDVLTDLDVTSLVTFHKEKGGEGTIALHPVDDPSRYGVVPTDADGRVVAFVEKPPKESAPTNLINAGTYVFEPSVLDRIPFGEKVSIERVTFPEMVAEGQLFAMEDDSYWLDTGTPEAYLTAHFDILEGKRATAQGVENISDGNYVAPGVEIPEDASLHESVVDIGAVIGHGVRITRSVLLPGVVVGDGATIDHSIVGAGASIGSDATLGATSVIGFGATVSPGTTLSDARVE